MLRRVNARVASIMWRVRRGHVRKCKDFRCKEIPPKNSGYVDLDTCRKITALSLFRLGFVGCFPYGPWLFCRKVIAIVEDIKLRTCGGLALGFEVEAWR